MRDKHHNSIALLLFIISASILFALTIYTSFMMESISTYLKDNIQERLLSVSRLAAAEISPEELEQLDSPDDVDTALFQEVRERLITFGEENNVVFVYYMRVNEDGLYQFIVDNDTTEESVNLASEPIEPEESPNLAQSGTAATSGLENYSIGYEGLLSAYAPIYDARGNVIAVAGVDISDEQILTVSKHTRNLIITLIISVVLVVISGLTNILLQVRRQRRLRTNLKQQRLMSEISQSFISDTPMTALIEDALHRTGEFLKVDRCLIVTVNKDTDTERPIYLWTSLQHGQTSAPNASFREALHTMFPSTAPETKAVAPFFCNDTDSENSGENSQRAVFDEAGLKAFIISPLYVEGTLWGILSIESRTKKRQWSDSDAQLVTTLSSAIAGAVARDLIEKERAAALERAVLASQAKGDFLSNMSHEMRTPMNAIIGMSSIGASSTELARKDYCFGRINDASSHLLGIINDVLDISKIEANRLELSYVSFSIEKMVEKVVSVIGFRVDEQQQELRVTLDDDVPHDIVTDDQRLAQVVTNLLSNAVKFTPEGGAIELNIHLLGEEDGLFTLQFEVSDTGIGISPEQQERLFTSFEQADRSTSRRFGGTGLGLAISKRIVELMGGTIWIESELGRGATFKFTIKTRRGKGEEHRYLPADVNWDNVRILAVDDAEETRGYFEQIAERFGILCDTAADGEEALAQIARADDEAARAGTGGGGAGG
ncbi:MAG: GAF domain-containing protein, partial [Coriobacteriales bacterium]|nr:GAF domain-containing protein [Coriobacteriales bacterium]